MESNGSGGEASEIPLRGALLRGAVWWSWSKIKLAPFFIKKLASRSSCVSHADFALLRWRGWSAVARAGRWGGGVKRHGE